MGRVKTVDGKRVSIGLKVSEAKAETINAARGATPRALWLEAAIDAYLALPVKVAATERQSPPEPADPPAAPVAPPQGQSAPMERSEAPGPRTDPEPAPERKRKAPAKRAAAAPEPIADEAPAPLAAAHALAEAVGAPMKMAGDLPPAPKPPPAHDPTVPVFQEAGEDAYIPPLLAPDDEERPRKPCRHPASLIRPDGTCECGEEMYS